MDLSFTPADEAFREEARTWLAENVPADPLASMDTPGGFEEHRAWEHILFDAGWAVVSWPKRHGGREASLVEWLIFEEEYWASGAPGRVSSNGVSLLAPTIFDFGTPEQQDRFLRPMARGDEVWAQGWSEPDAGSDLAGIKTKAQRDGEYFVIDGQKTWCSRGAFADWFFCLVRTDPDSERHAGLSYLLVPGDTEGLEARAIGRLDGEPGFAELFFDGARVHERYLLGGEGEGWAVAMATTGSERGLNLRAPGRFMAAADRLVGLYQELAENREPDLDRRNQVVDAWMGAQAYRWQTYATEARLRGGAPIGSEASFMKVLWSELDVELHATRPAAFGPRRGAGRQLVDGRLCVRPVRPDICRHQ